MKSFFMDSNNHPEIILIKKVKKQSFSMLKMAKVCYVKNTDTLVI